MIQIYAANWTADERIVEVTMNGFWTEADIPGFMTCLAPVVRQAAGRSFDVIADHSHLHPQSQSVVALQGQVAAGLVAAGMVRVVIVGAGPLLTMQVKRALTPVVPHFTSTVEEARAWLSDDR